MFKILLVDDTKAVHTFVKDLLKAATDIQFTDAFNGAEAVELVRKGEKFDLVLLDWEMPIKTGPECLNELKALGFPSPIVMMTTKNSPDEIAHLLEIGAAEYMLKPFTVDILKEKIEYVCGQVFHNVA
ncbi:MAG: response regulator [Bdellovibrionales bacterium]|nr:response regulator [Bdellovibrionales bacterium]